LFDSTEVLNLRKKTSNIYKWKENVQKTTCRRRKSLVTKAAFKGGELALKHNQISEVFKGFKVHDFEYYGKKSYVLKWKFSLCH